MTQSAHALAEFIFSFPEESKKWHSSSNYLVCLSVKDENDLLELSRKLNDKSINHKVFREPDINNQVTAIAIEHHDDVRKICSSFPLAMKGYLGINKHSTLNTTEKIQ